MDGLSNRIEKRISELRPKDYRDKEAYESDVELYRSDLMMPVYWLRLSSYESMIEKMSATLRSYPSTALFELFRKKMKDYYLLSQDCLTFLKKRAQLFDTYIKYSKIKYHDLDKSVNALERQVNDIRSRLVSLGMEC